MIEVQFKIEQTLPRLDARGRNIFLDLLVFFSCFVLTFQSIFNLDKWSNRQEKGAPLQEMMYSRNPVEMPEARM